MMATVNEDKNDETKVPDAVAHPDFELGRWTGCYLLAQPAFLPSVISSFLTQNKGAGPSPRSATKMNSVFVVFRWFVLLTNSTSKSKLRRTVELYLQ